MGRSVVHDHYEIIERTGSIEKSIMIKSRLWLFDIFLIM